MHASAFQFVRDAVAQAPLRRGLTVEIGGRNINGSVRGLFPGPYLSIDCRPGLGVDVVADGATYVPPTPAVRVVCCEVLEHTTDAPLICRQAYSMLDVSGLFIVTAAGPTRPPHSAHDGGSLRPGEFYRGVSTDDLSRWLGQFERTEIVEQSDVGDVYALAWK